jgi:RND family efflux transporter MFP subunit
VAELQLKVAEQALGEAQRQLDGATIIAPFMGIIASVYIDEGDTVSTATRIIHMIDLSSMELKAEVDEIDIAVVKLGQRAVISVDALPDFLFDGEISSISLIPTVEAGLVAYDVTISFDVPQDSSLRIGMSATVDIIIDERSDALLVPDRAIKQDSRGNPVVQVMVDEQIQQRQVAVGISDGFQTEIVSGLEEGETVVIDIKSSTESSNPGGFPFTN